MMHRLFMNKMVKINRHSPAECMARSPGDLYVFSQLKDPPHSRRMTSYVLATLFFILTFFTFSLQAVASAATPITKAKQAYLFNPDTGVVLFELNADQLMVPSSMTKIMTVYLLFEHIKSGDVKLKDEFPVSKLAWRKGGAKMFVEVNSKVSIEDLIRGMIVQSGNDACIVVAEGLAGNEGVFAVEMTRKARELGARNTTFKNSTGWPDPSHLTTAKDLAIISQKLIKNFPDFYKTYFSQKEFTYNNIRQENRNPLLYKDMGVDGLKTGATNMGGFGLVASGIQDGQRLILVVNGLKTIGERARESEALLKWGFRNFATKRLFAAGEEVARASVWLGNKPDIPLIIDRDLLITVPRSQLKELKVEAVYQEPVDISKIGQVVGKVTVTLPNQPTIEVPLKAVGDVSPAGFFERMRAAVYYLIWGYNEQPV